MPWNDGGPGPGLGLGSGPWGPSGGSGDPPSGGNNGNRQQRPDSPWGSGGASGKGGRRGPGGGSGGGSGGGPGGRIPDLDTLIADLQARARALLGGGIPGSWGGGRGIALLAIAVVAVWLASGFYRVQPDEQGVVLRFGAFTRTTLPGLNYHLPWPVESVLRPAVTRINRLEIGYRSGAIASASPTGRDQPTREVPEESLMLTGDENIIDINCAVFWRIRDASAFLFATRDPRLTIKSVAESVMREVIARTPIQLALTERRAQIEADVTRTTQAILENYGAGVEVTQVQLQKVDPPAAVIDSFRDVQRANTDAERLRNEAESYRNDIIPRARGDAARLTAEAEGARLASIAEATGQTQRFLSVLAAYEAAKDITLRRMYIETMQDILTRTPSVVVDDQLKGLVPFLPLGELARPAVPAAPPPPPAPLPTGRSPQR